VTDGTLYEGSTQSISLESPWTAAPVPVSLDVSNLPTARVERAARFESTAAEHAGACVSLAAGLYVEGLEDVLFEKASYLVTTVLPVGELASVHSRAPTPGVFAERRLASSAGSVHHVLTFDRDRALVCSAVCRGACAEVQLRVTGEGGAPPPPGWLASTAESCLEHRGATGALLAVTFFAVSAWTVARRPGARPAQNGMSSSLP
jgi:hypothetical protein